MSPTPATPVVRLLGIAGVALASIAAGCGYGKAVLPAPAAGFVERRPEDAAGVVTEGLPFQYVWYDPEYADVQAEVRERATYRLFVAPVGTLYLALEGERELLRDNAAEIAVDLRERVAREIADREGGSYRVDVVEDRADAEYGLEIELTEIGLGSPLLYAVAWITPIPGVATSYDAAHTSVLAIEGRIVEVASGRVVSEFYDRRIPKVRVIDVNKMTSTMGPLRDITGDWATEISSAVTSRRDRDEVESESSFTLLPW